MNATNVPQCGLGFVCGWDDCPVHGVVDDGGPVVSACTPDVGEGWKVFVVRLSENHYRTMFSCAGRHFTLADADDQEEGLTHCTHIRDCFQSALDYVYASGAAALGGLLVTAQAIALSEGRRSWDCTRCERRNYDVRAIWCRYCCPRRHAREVREAYPETIERGLWREDDS